MQYIRESKYNTPWANVNMLANTIVTYCLSYIQWLVLHHCLIEGDFLQIVCFNSGFYQKKENWSAVLETDALS